MEQFDIVRLFLVLLLNSMLICGMHYAFSYDEILIGYGERLAITNKKFLWFVQFYAKKYLGEFLAKPFGGCMICMASVWSIPVFFYFYPLSIAPYGLICSMPIPQISNLGLYLLYIPALAGINRIIIRWL